MGMTVIDLPAPGREELFNWIQERKVWGRLNTVKSGWSVNQLRTKAVLWKLTLSHMMTYLVCSGLWTLVSMSCKLSRNVIICAVLYGPRVAWWWTTPFWLIAAHIVMLPPRCPGSLIMARCPIMFLPRLLVLVRLKPASSTKSCSWPMASASSSITLLTRQNKCSTSGPCTALCTSRFSTNDTIAYLHIVISQLFYTFTLSFKRDFVDLFHPDSVAGKYTR